VPICTSVCRRWQLPQSRRQSNSSCCTCSAVYALDSICDTGATFSAASTWSASKQLRGSCLTVTQQRAAHSQTQRVRQQQRACARARHVRDTFLRPPPGGERNRAMIDVHECVSNAHELSGAPFAGDAAPTCALLLRASDHSLDLLLGEATGIVGDGDLVAVTGLQRESRQDGCICSSRGS
jgi:hypothetical protein